MNYFCKAIENFTKNDLPEKWVKDVDFFPIYDYRIAVDYMLFAFWDYNVYW